MSATTDHAPEILRTTQALRRHIGAWREAGDTIAFVPTMGALHAGHLSLITLAREKADHVIASIFVNPTQFAPDEDFDNYPRGEAQDVAKLWAAGCHTVYIPHKGSMYNAHHATQIKVGGVASGLETDHRPSFFDGVALVVTKLLNRVTPDIAVFGEKDYQQLATIRRLVADLDMPVKIIGAPIARDDHGLALSSRNAYFDADGLAVARRLNVIMRDCRDALNAQTDIADATAQCRAALLAAGFSHIDYISVADTDTLETITSGPASIPARLLIAAHCEGVRLIDNCPIGPNTGDP